MGWGEEEIAVRKKMVPLGSEKVRENIANLMRWHYEPMLKELGLSKDQIAEQSLGELKESLERAQDALNNPNSFGVLRVEVNAEGNALLASSNSRYNFEIGVVPILLDRKKLILERIRVLSANEKIETLHDLINQIPDEEVKEKLELELNSLKTENQQIREQQKEVEQEQTLERQKTQIDLARLSVELFERRTKVWFSLLERESSATIIGGFLLIVIVISQIAAIFAKITIPEILNSAFLLILGYFFGQSTNQSSSK